MKKTIPHSTLYICILILMLSEINLNGYCLSSPFLDEFNIMFAILNSIVMGISYIGVIAIVDVFLKTENYKYINLLGVSLLALLFSCLMLNDVEFSMKENSKIVFMIQLVIYQIGSLIKIYIPILIVLCNENLEGETNENLFKKYRKPIAYIAISLIVAILLNDYRLMITVLIISCVPIILKK